MTCYNHKYHHQSIKVNEMLENEGDWKLDDEKMKKKDVHGNKSKID